MILQFRYFLLLALLTGRVCAFAQSGTIDSLHTVVKTTKSDTVKINALNELADRYRKKADYEQAVTYASNALSLAEKVKHKRGMAKSYNHLGTISRNKGEYDKAIEHYTKAIQLFIEVKDNYALASCYGSTGLAWYNMGDYDKALEFHHKDMKTCEEMKDKKGMTYSINNIGLIYFNRGDYDKALVYYLRSLKIDEELNDKKGMAISFNNIGLVHFDKGEYDKAVDYFIRSLKIKEELKDKKGVGATYNNIANVYLENSDYDKALEYYFKSLTIREELSDKKGISVALNNIGNVYSAKNEDDKAIEFYEKALRLREETGDKQGLASSYVSVGKIHFRKSEFGKAHDFFIKALELSHELGDKKSISTTYHSLANLFLKKGDTKKARENELLALKYAAEINAKPDIKDAFFLLYQCDSLDGNFQDALHYYRNFSLMKDTIFNDESNKNLKEIQTRYETEKKEAQISLLSKDRMLQQSQLEKQRILLEKTNQQKLLLEQENKIKLFEITQSKAKLKEQEILSENRKKENELLLKDKQLKEAEAREKQEQVEKQKIQIYFFAGGGLLLLVVALLAVRGYYQKKKANTIISRQKQEVETQKAIVEEKNQEILDSIIYAKHLQTAILPPISLWKQTFPDSFIFYKPKDIVAGDFYFLEQHGNCVIFAAADCTGHGVPGAMVSVVCSNALNRAVKEFGITDPGKILDKTRELVLETFSKSEDDVNDGMDISLCVIDTANKKLYWSGANNPLWIVEGKSHEAKAMRKEMVDSLENISLMAHGSLPPALKEYKANKQPIGKSFDKEKFNTHSVQIEKGDTLYLFTDGFQDQFGGDTQGNTSGKKYNISRLRNFILSVQHEPMNIQEDLFEKEFNRWKGQLEQIDDVCIIGVRL